MRSSNTSLDLLGTVIRAGCLAAALAGTAHAIDPGRAMSQYVRDRWGAEQGFPRGPVYAIAQSADGYLWVGMQAGLVRFDGLNFRVFREAPGLQNGEAVLGLLADREGSLWIRLEDGLLRYRNGTFDRPVPPLNTRVSSMARSISGDLLLSAQENAAMTYRHGHLEMVEDARVLPRSPVLAIAQTADGSVWCGTRGSGLFRLHQGRALPVSEGLPDPKVNCLLAGAKGDLWAGTDSGIARWNGSALAPLGAASLQGVQVLAMERDRDGNIWAGTDSRGLLRINEQGGSRLEPAGRQSLQAVTAVFEDREGDLWSASDGAIERLRDSAFVTYSEPEGLPAGGNSPIFVDAENRLWFAPAGGGLWWMEEGRRGRVSMDGLDRDVVYSIAGRNRELWLGRQHGGLTRLATEGGRFTARTYTKADGLAQDSVFSVYQARDGSVWAGTLSGGVSKLSGSGFRTYTSATGLLSNTVTSILEGADGTMWLATTGGLNALAGDRWRGYTEKDGLPSDNVYCLLEDSTGVLWIGTAAGLAFRNGKAIRAPAVGPGWLREATLGMEEDREGSLWLATSHHVVRVNRARLLAGALAEGDFRDYGVADGLRGMEGVRRHLSVMEDGSGRVWLSLNRGISMVDPARLRRNAAPAIVNVQAISADNNPVPLEGQVHVPGGRRRVTFGYAGLSLAVPEQVRFRYRLDGFDSAWSSPVSLREAEYTNLAPAHYRFRVIAMNPDSGWNSNEGTVAFEVDPLFWQTWWFRLATVLAFAATVLLIYRLRMQKMADRLHLRFEELLTERTRIAQELHDTLLQGFLSASMQVHVAADSLPADSAAKPTLTRALQLMRQVIDEGRTAVRGLRSRNSASLDLEHVFARVQQELVPGSTAEQARFRVVVEGERKPLHPLLRDDVYRIGREALINAFRHSRARNVEVEVQYTTSRLRVLIRDDGCGIEPDILKSGRDGHWGLPGMRERAEQIGGRLQVYSNIAAGTEVVLSVPGHVAFQGYPGKRPWWFGRERASAKGNGK